MPQIPIIMPQLGESIAEATVVNLLVKVGDSVEADQSVMEVETNKATMNVASPCSGRVQQLLVKLNESYAVDSVLGYLEASPEEAARLGLDGLTPDDSSEKTGPAPTDDGKTSIAGRKSGVEPTVRGLPVPANADGRELHVAAHESAHE